MSWTKQHKCWKLHTFQGNEAGGLKNLSDSDNGCNGQSQAAELDDFIGGKKLFAESDEEMKGAFLAADLDATTGWDIGDLFRRKDGRLFHESAWTVGVGRETRVKDGMD